MSDFLNHPALKSAARQFSDAIDYPDTMWPAITNFLYNTINGKAVYDPFEKSVVFAGDLVLGAGKTNEYRQWYGTELMQEQVRHLPLGNDFVPLLFWLVFYLVSLAILAFAAKAIAYPGRFELKTFALVHNAFLCLLSFYMGVSIFANALAEPHFSFVDMAVTKRPTFVKALWLFVLSKITEFVDTYIMVLKQNYHQVTFLHVYHHLSILVFVVLFCGPAPGSLCFLSAGMNSFPIHTFMYLYYFLASFAGKTGPLRSFLNSIKFFITKGQLTQFTINLLHAAYFVFIVGDNTQFPKAQMKWMIVYMLTMLGLFGSFLIQGQRAAAREKKLAKALAEKKKAQ